MVHRDIKVHSQFKYKPENFIITAKKDLKLIDFGTAVIYD